MKILSLSIILNKNWVLCFNTIFLHPADDALSTVPSWVSPCWSQCWGEYHVILIIMVPGHSWCRSCSQCIVSRIVAGAVSLASLVTAAGQHSLAQLGQLCTALVGGIYWFDPEIDCNHIWDCIVNMIGQGEGGTRQHNLVLPGFTHFWGTWQEYSWK